MVATGKAAEFGILFKGGEPLEVAGKTTICIFDKTGTLTQGQMQIVGVYKVSDKALNDILSPSLKRINNNSMEHIGARHAFWNFVYGAEQQSEHLIASAVCKFIKGDKMKQHSSLRDANLGYDFVCNHWSPDEFIPLSGYGVTAVYKECKIQIGNKEYMQQNEISFGKFAKSLSGRQGNDKEIVWSKVNELEASGNTVIFVAANGELCAILAIADQIKEDAQRVIDYLQTRENILCYMITGDNEVTANAICKIVGIPR